jgi:hypothetical protein
VIQNPTVDNARAVAADALKLFKRSRAGVPGLARVLAESLSEVLVEYDAAVRRADDLGQRLETVRAILDGDDGDPDGNNGGTGAAPR